MAWTVFLDLTWSYWYIPLQPFSGRALTGELGLGVPIRWGKQPSRVLETPTLLILPPFLQCLLLTDPRKKKTAFLTGPMERGNCGEHPHSEGGVQWPEK